MRRTDVRHARRQHRGTMQFVALRLQTRPIEGLGGAGGRRSRPSTLAPRADEAEIVGRLRALLGRDAELAPASSPSDPIAVRADLLLVTSVSAIQWPRVRAAVAADPDRPVIVVAERWRDEDELMALGAAASGYLALDLPPDVVSRSLRAALRGEVVFRRKTLGRWLRPRLRRTSRIVDLPKLTGRQREVASLLTTGAADKEIAVRLGIGVATVQKHVSKLLRTVGASNRAAAVWLVLGGTHIAEQ